MTFDFGKLKVNVTSARGVRERESSDSIEYRVTVTAPGVARFTTNTWKQRSWSQSEEKVMEEIAVSMMYTLAKAWSDPRGFISEEIQMAKVFAKVSSRSIESVEEKAVELTQYTSTLSPFMDEAVAALWSMTRRDDPLWQRGPREWFPGKRKG